MIICGLRALFKFYCNIFLVFAFFVVYVKYGLCKEVNPLTNKERYLCILQNYNGYILGIPMGYIHSSDVADKYFFPIGQTNTSIDYLKSYYLVGDYYSSLMDLLLQLAEFDESVVHFKEENLYTYPMKICFYFKYQYDDVRYLKEIITGYTKNYKFLSKWELLCHLCKPEN